VSALTSSKLTRYLSV